MVRNRQFETYAENQSDNPAPSHRLVYAWGWPSIFVSNSAPRNSAHNPVSIQDSHKGDGRPKAASSMEAGFRALRVLPSSISIVHSDSRVQFLGSYMLPLRGILCTLNCYSSKLAQKLYKAITKHSAPIETCAERILAPLLPRRRQTSATPWEALRRRKLLSEEKLNATRM